MNLDAFKVVLIFSALGFLVYTLYHVYMVIYTGANPFQ